MVTFRPAVTSAFRSFADIADAATNVTEVPKPDLVPLQEVAKLPLVMTADPPHHCLAGNLARLHEPIVASYCRNSLGVGAIKKSAVRRYNLCARIWDRPARVGEGND